MSIYSSNIRSNNIVQLENRVSYNSSKIQDLIDVFSDQTIISYDQTTKQNVSISFDNERYRFEIQKPENQVFMYQVWKKNNEELNLDRKYKNISLRDWISLFKSNSDFTPTTLIEINNIFYPSIMVGAAIENDSCIFYFDITKIESENNIQNILPKNGSYSNVRFDIDSVESPIQNLINLMLAPILESLNIQTASFPIEIPDINKPVSEDGGIFVVDVSASNFSIIINNINNLQLNFKRYYGQKYLEFTTTLSCNANIGSLNFTGIRCLLDSYEDVNFTNVKVPFNLDVNFKFDRNDISKSVISLSIPNSDINFDQSMTNFWNDYWQYRINVATGLEAASITSAALSLGLAAGSAVYFASLIAALTLVKNEFPGTLNSQANFKNVINGKLNDITPLITSYLSSSESINLYNKYKYLIDIIFQSNLSQWDFGPILCVDTSYIYMNGGYDIHGCDNIASQNYAFVTTDTPFSGTNFPSNQIYIVKTSDYSSCYAINMQNTMFELFSYIPRINISGYEPASVLLKTDDPDGTLELSKPIIYGFYQNIQILNYLSLSPSSVFLGNPRSYMNGKITKNGGFYAGFQVSYNSSLNDQNITTYINPPLIRNYIYIDTKNIKEIETNTIFTL